MYEFKTGTVYASDPRGGYKRFADTILSEVTNDLNWHQSKVRIAKIPRFPLPLAQYIIRTAKEAGISVHSEK